MRCSNCGKELTAQDKFCSQCGTPVPQEKFCSNCGKKLAPEDKFCSQCGKTVAAQAGTGSQCGKTVADQAGTGSQRVKETAGVQNQAWPAIYRDRTDLLRWLAFHRSQIAGNDLIDSKLSRREPDSITAKLAVSYAAHEMEQLAALKKIDNGIQQTPEPVTTAERRAYLQEALAVTERVITPEWKSKDPKGYSLNVDKKNVLQKAIKAIDKGKVTSRVIFCPHCNKWTDTDFTHCVHCYKSINPSAPRPVPQSGQQPAFAASTQSAPKPAAAASRPAAAPQPAPRPAAAPQPQAGGAQVRYADASIKDWTKLPGEKTERSRHVIGLLQPKEGKFTYFMEVTNQRLLLWRESNASATFGSVASMGGGLLGQLISAGAKAAVGAGRKPWLEIPLTAISSCGLRNKGEFFIEADQTYVLVNDKKYENLLPELVEKAKRGV